MRTGVLAGPRGWAWRVLAGWAAAPQPAIGAAFCLAALAYALAVHALPALFAPSGLVLLLLVGAFVLRWRWLRALVASVVLLTAALAPAEHLSVGEVAVLVLACGAVVTFGVERERLGLQGAPSALMLVDLRDRLAVGGRLPALPRPWRADAEVRSAHGSGFSGDFVVAHRDGDRFEVVLVDVSGKGQAAGVRALQLQGALGGLLGALPVEQFLPAANRYLLEQDWDEGFATAVHLALDLATGDYRVALAGHPAPAVRHAGSGRIEVLAVTGGVALGVVDDAVPGTVTGRLAPGDVVVLYTDGLVEAPGRDVDQGVDRLLGVVEAVVAARPGGARDVLAGVHAGEDDDRAVVVVRREPT